MSAKPTPSERSVSERHRRHSQASIKLINRENGLVITQLTEADFRRLQRIIAPDDLADKLALFVAYLDGENRVRGYRS